ncbi:MAG: hypothetical protein QOF48_57 [Verrucomicrobiota bacterium]
MAFIGAAERDSADRGPFFSGTIRARFPGDNTAMKGIVVTVGTETNAYMCYDTDLMRVSVGWTGGYLNFGNYMKEISHPQPPEVAGAVAFGTKPGPGWARDGSFTDPRLNKQGPLPAEWAKYRGLYLQDRQVILSYTVNGTGVLEMPGAMEREGLKLFTRTIQLDKPSRLTLLVCDGLPEGLSGHGQGNRAVVVADFKGAQGAERFGAALSGAPEASIEAADGRVFVVLSGKEKPGTSFQVVMWSGMSGEGPKFVQAVRSLPEPPRLKPMTKGGPARWTKPFITKGALMTSGGTTTTHSGKASPAGSAEIKTAKTVSSANAGGNPYVVDTICENLSNPWGTRAFIGGFDFFPDGRAAICTFHGDVWVVSGIDEKLEKLTWRRFATGIFQGLGLKVVDGKIYVLGRDQITRLHDLNNDGEADFYENFNNDTVVTANYHEFCLDLHTDSKGNFYFFKGSPWSPDVKSPHQGTLLKVSKDGAKLEVFATGFRAPNGSAIGPHDEITVSDNQGHWMPSSKLNLVRKNGFYGMMPAAQHELTMVRNGTNLLLNPSDPQARAAFKVKASDGDAPIPIGYDQPICWLPMNMDNSSGGQVWATSDKWGPLKNHLLFMSYGRGTLFYVMQEQIEGVTQAAMVKLPLKFGTGLMRGRVNPHDGQVYVSGLKGWQTDAQKDGGVYRVRYTSSAFHSPVDFHVLKDGLRIVFGAPLDRASATDAANYSIEQWNYVYTGNYGSPELSVTEPMSKKHDAVELKSVRLGKDARTVLLSIPGLRAVDQMKIKLNLKAADGTLVTDEIYNTIHKLGGSSIAAQ